MSTTGTMRGTPSRQGRPVSTYNSPAGSSIPRPSHELPHHSTHSPAAPHSDVGGSTTMSSRRQKKTESDEVSARHLHAIKCSPHTLTDKSCRRPSGERSRRTSARRSIPLDAPDRPARLPQEVCSPSDHLRPCRSSQTPLSLRRLS